MPTEKSVPAASPSNRASVSSSDKSYFATLTSLTGNSGRAATAVALTTLLLLWAAKVAMTWGAWGDLTVDCGREMYVPWILSQGKQLYRDVWFLNGPVAPYFNSYLFRLFGLHLSVLYWAGSFAALGSAIFLFLTGRRVGSALAGWVAGAVVVLEAFQPSLFCFPLPYSFSAVYGCLIACCVLWLMVRAAASANRLWILAAGIAAALAILDKLEIGAACCAALALLLAGRALQQRSWESFLRDLAATLPGTILFALTAAWMISIKGLDFITQENFLTWPTSYFMKAYGKFWLASTGFGLNSAAFLGSAQRTAILFGVLQGGHLAATWKTVSPRLRIVRLLVGVVAVAGLVAPLSWRDSLLNIFFPQDMVLYVAIAALAAWWHFYRNRYSQRALQLAVLLSFSSLLAFRILLKTQPSGYSIYYNGPAVLSLFVLFRAGIRYLFGARWTAKAAELAFAAMCLLSVCLHVSREGRHANDYEPIITDRGMLRTWPEVASDYGDAIAFLKEKQASGDLVLSVPEDTSLYFLSGVECPLRVYQFVPGVVAPGKMTDEVIAEIEGKKIRYLLWSNRVFPEYGVPRFGTDFNQDLGAYLRSHYRPVGNVAKNPAPAADWAAFIWERQDSVGKP